MNISNLKHRHKNTTTYFTHGFHPYPAKFTPQLVSKYLDLYCTKYSNILDPFCGSGTTLVESILRDMNCTGIDINPIATLISTAKTNMLNEDQIKFLIQFISDLNFKISDIKYSSWIEEIKVKIQIPDFYNIEHWFSKSVILELSILKYLIYNIEDEKVKILCKCALSKIIVKVSNQDSEVRYSRKVKNHPEKIVYLEFIKTINNYIKIFKNEKYKIRTKAKVIKGDTFEILRNIKQDNFDFAITSPPYINTFDYYLYHKQRMLWLDFDYKIVRKQELGNHHRMDSKSYESAKEEYENCMLKVINEISRVSKKNSLFVMIIGDGIKEKRVIDMSKVIEEIILKTSYEIIDITSVNLFETTKSFNKKFANAPKKEHNIILKNLK